MVDSDLCIRISGVWSRRQISIHSSLRYKCSRKTTYSCEIATFYNTHIALAFACSAKRSCSYIVHLSCTVVDDVRFVVVSVL